MLCLQETWHTKQDLASFKNLHRKCHGIGESAMDDSYGLRCGHAPGWVAIIRVESIS